MSEMIERIARLLHSQDADAICGADDQPPAASGWPPDRPFWTNYIDDAREVIEAMREPTDAMCDKVRNDWELDERMTWQAMIDAALA